MNANSPAAASAAHVRRAGTFSEQEKRCACPDELERRAIAHAKQGDWDAVHYLYVRYAADVAAYVRSILRDHHAAEDVTQNVFAKLATAIRKYEQRDVAFAAWIFRVARNASLDYLRAQRQVPVEEVRLADEPDHLDLDRRQTLIDAIASLPPDQQEVLVLRHLCGLSPTEIATRLGKTEGSVHGLHHRGRAALKQVLRALGSSPVTAA